jgi:hypothetical protein
VLGKKEMEGAIILLRPPEGSLSAGPYAAREEDWLLPKGQGRLPDYRMP